MKALPALIAFAVLALVSLACGATPTPAPGQPTYTPRPAATGVGYLWWTDAESRHVAVPVFAPVHQSGTVNAEQMQLWMDRGEVCAAAPGSKVGPGSGQHPPLAKSVEVLDGTCRGFRGWVDLDVWHAQPLP